MTHITIITPVLNNAKTIGHCLRSIADQTVSCQHIIIDGESSDGTLEVIEKENKANAILLSEPDKGMYEAINKGLELATGEVIGILNADDYYPTCGELEKVADAFSDQEVDATFGDLKYVDRKDINKSTRNWHSGEYNPKRFYHGWMPPHPTFFLRLKFYQQYGTYRLDMGSAADYELMLRMLLKHRIRPAYIPHCLVHMRTDGMSNSSLKNRIKANRSDRDAWRVNGIQPLPWTIAAKPLRKLTQWVIRR